MHESTIDLTFQRVPDADETALRVLFDLMSQVTAQDLPADPPPCWTDVRGRLAPGRVGLELQTWLAYSGDTAVASGTIILPTLDNLGSAVVDGFVAPQWRRRGVGTRLLAHTVGVARRAGRSRLFLEARQPVAGTSPGAAFLAAAGARLGMADQRRRLEIGTLDQATTDRLEAQARAAASGYELVQWIGATPEDRLADIARLAAAISTDAPKDDLTVEAEVWDTERMRGRDISLDARGVRRTVTAAVAPDGRLAAYTMLLGYESVDWFAAQTDTIVLQQHRGHRLGMLVKLANLALARAEQPTLRVIDTHNAESNAHMVAINEAMGFRPIDRLGEWELDF
jgi:GNAT superfamily N-acetyltransferase